MSQYVVPMRESERGWGSKIDGYAGPFDTLAKAEDFRDLYNSKYNNAASAPDWYIVAEDPEVFKGQKCDYHSVVDAAPVNDGNAFASLSDESFLDVIAGFLFGPRYQRSLAVALGRNERTIRRYLRGESPIPEELWAEFALILLSHEKALHSLGDELVRRVKPRP